MTHAGEQGTAARRLEKIAFDYSPVEDRVLARLQAKSGEVSGAWLTQRMARRLVRLLCEHLEKTSAAETGGLSRRTSDSRRQEELLLSFRHQAAVMKHKRGTPVPPVDTADAPLLQSIRARMSEKHIVLTFALADRPSALALTQDHSWQLLQLLLNLFRRADWPVDAWPAWMREDDSAAAQPLH